MPGKNEGLNLLSFHSKSPPNKYFQYFHAIYIFLYTLKSPAFSIVLPILLPEILHYGKFCIRSIPCEKNEAQNCVLSDFKFGGRFIGPPLFS